MHIRDIYIYPVKSLGGIRVTTSRALERGFYFDRRWMLTDESGTFITQRVYHQLALLKTEITDTGILVSNRSKPKESVAVPFNLLSEETIKVSVWDDTIEALHVDNSVDEWFSDFLKLNCKLVYLPESGERPVDRRYADNNEQVSFADAFPYLLITQASLDDLNERLDVPVPMDRFRPNLVIAGASAFEEDNWKEVRIGEVHFKVAKPCARCVMTTVDQQSGVKGKEPLYTLSKYRKVNNKILFGQNLIALNEGIIREGDLLEVVL